MSSYPIPYPQLCQCDVTEDYLSAEEDRALGRRAELMSQMEAE